MVEIRLIVKSIKASSFSLVAKETRKLVCLNLILNRFSFNRQSASPKLANALREIELFSGFVFQPKSV